MLPPPLAGEGWGGGQPIASDPPPSQPFPRKRGKGSRKQIRDYT